MSAANLFLLSATTLVVSNLEYHRHQISIATSAITLNRVIFTKINTPRSGDKLRERCQLSLVKRAILLSTWAIGQLRIQTRTLPPALSTLWRGTTQLSPSLGRSHPEIPRQQPILSWPTKDLCQALILLITDGMPPTYPLPSATFVINSAAGLYKSAVSASYQFAKNAASLAACKMIGGTQ